MVGDTTQSDPSLGPSLFVSQTSSQPTSHGLQRTEIGRTRSRSRHEGTNIRIHACLPACILDKGLFLPPPPQQQPGVKRAKVMTQGGREHRQPAPRGPAYDPTIKLCPTSQGHCAR
ncbi:hypothetical protein NW767_007176 [Fusarium falciforme]|uniref:Uncharacterized protein n=1 Tax=Fusarium falciforme TaxID=195108 RepID=A0A9W8QYI2_9HYPO|nr:hypothetical protein NW755_010308 [Fusarium falciforme]KAJ4201040.1 hypothetical protein NW767_007176 [Fusarium falciforme]